MRGDGRGRPNPELDLAFTVDENLAPALLLQGGVLADAITGEKVWQQHLRHWLADLASELPDGLRAVAYSAGLNLCDDGTMAALNEEWRQVQGPTDVLAFAAREQGLDSAPAPPLPDAQAGAGEPLELGDIVISLETAARQAAATGLGLERELTWLASHGLLHLLGWDHPDDARLEAMLARQDRLLAVLDGSPGGGPPGGRR